MPAKHYHIMKVFIHRVIQNSARKLLGKLEKTMHCTTRHYFIMSQLSFDVRPLDACEFLAEQKGR